MFIGDCERHSYVIIYLAYLTRSMRRTIKLYVDMKLQSGEEMFGVDTRRVDDRDT